jgi:hypothetical protein
MLLDTRNCNICGLEVGISMVFEIIRHFLFEGLGDGTTIQILSDGTWHKKQEYIWFREGDLNSF